MALMGIRIHATWPGPGPGATCSLPLMGIGILGVPAKLGGHVGDSLPLMGIRIIRRGASPGARSTTHYPSWGFRIPSICKLTEWRRCRSHYPSWGSGSPRRPVKPSSTPPSSLPLMGIRITLLPPPAPPVIRSHYPSWGSGSLVDMAERNVIGALTTPHGDQDRPSAAYRVCDSWSHYPSWGSGSRAPCRAPEPRERAHYPSWGSGS